MQAHFYPHSTLHFYKALAVLKCATFKLWNFLNNTDVAFPLKQLLKPELGHETERNYKSRFLEIFLFGRDRETSRKCKIEIVREGKEVEYTTNVKLYYLSSVCQNNFFETNLLDVMLPRENSDWSHRNG